MTLPVFTWLHGGDAGLGHAVASDDVDVSRFVRTICGAHLIKPMPGDGVRHCKRCARKIRTWKNAEHREQEVFGQLIRSFKPRGV